MALALEPDLGSKLRRIIRDLFALSEPEPKPRPRVVVVTLLVTIEDKANG